MLQRLKGKWMQFIETGEMQPNDDIRQDILDSWQRCKGVVDPLGQPQASRLSKDEINQIINDKQELIDAAYRIMQNLFRFVAGSGFVVCLMDEGGRLLRVLGDPELFSVRNSYFHLGSEWLEEKMGTNAVSLALRQDNPLQIYSYEHYCSYFHKFTCSAAPIHDPSTNETIGILNMSGNYKLVHDHTLGMVVAAVNAIENQIALRRAWKASYLANQYKSVIMESMNDGVIAIDYEGIITHINKRAETMLLFDNMQIIGSNIKTVLSDKSYSQLLKILREKREITDDIISISLPKSIARYTVTCRHLKTSEPDERQGVVVILQELARVKKLINQVYGNTARFKFEDIIGENTEFKNGIKLAKVAAQNSCNVLILGESGTGKDIIAQAIHNNSARALGPFIALNCAAITRDLLGSELFGYEDGAFTGAKKGGNAGKFELANGGTIFLDEIGEMPLEMQTYLLRVVEEGGIMRIGGRTPVPIDVRIIAATNKNLYKEVEKGNFRRDLFYRLNVMTINLPSLKERKDDLHLLTQSLTRNICIRLGKKYDGIDSEVISIFMSYPWIGNVRELQNVLERAVYLAGDNVYLSSELLPTEIKESSSCIDKPVEPSNTPLMNIEKATILSYMEKYNGNRTKVAKKLGIARSTLYKKLEKYNV